MSWLKENIDRLALILLSVGMIALSALLILRVLGFDQELAGVLAKVEPDHNHPPLNTKLARDTRESLDIKLEWERSLPSGGKLPTLFVSTPLVEKEGELVDILRPDSSPLRPPADNQWFLEHRLPITEGNVLAQDPDDDGFNNLEEWQGKTDPNQSESHPAYAQKLSLVRRKAIPFKLVFSARTGEDFQVNILPPHRSQGTNFVRVDGFLKDKRHQIVSFAEKEIVDDQNIKKDVSELTLLDTEIGEKFTLVKDQPVNRPTYFAILQYDWKGQSSIEVKLDDEFALENEPDTFYKLIDVTETQAVIQNVETEEKIVIPLAIAAQSSP